MAKPPAPGLSILQPLLGEWGSIPAGEEPASKMPCTRHFTKLWGGAYYRLGVRWAMEGGKVFEEVAMFGTGQDGSIGFWSFTSDGKQSHGWLTDGTDVHPKAIAFVAELPAGTARMVYWPEGDGFDYAVERRTADGWDRFMRHHYTPIVDPRPKLNL